MDAANIATRRKIKLLGYAILIPLLILIATFVLKEQGLPANKRIALSALIAESEAVTPPTGAVLLDRIETHKSSSALVSATYKSLSPRADISQHYSAQLRHSGWRQMQSDSGRSDAYCKDSLKAYLEFNPERKHYNFSIVWRRRPVAKC